MFSLIFGDPVVWGSLLGILIILIMAGYYSYLFIHHSLKSYDAIDEKNSYHSPKH